MNPTRLLWLAAACWLMLPSTVRAGAIESSYRAARAVVDAAVEAMEVAAWMNEPGPVIIKASGTLFMSAEHQGRSVEDPTPTPFLETWAFDPESGRVGREYRHSRHDGTVEWMKEVFEPDGARWWVDMASGQAYFEAPSIAGDARGANLRRFPALLLREALERPESLRGIGRYGPFDGIQASTGGDSSLSLFFGRESRMLGWVEYLVDLPSFSDSTVSWRFSGFRRRGRAGLVPHEYTIHINQSVYLDMQVNHVGHDAASVRSFLAVSQERPADYPESTPEPWARATLEEVGPGIWWLRNLRTGFHMLFVEFENYLLAVDAPSGYPLLQELPAGDVIGDRDKSSLTEFAIHKMAERVPGKPFRYAVLTHFHSDHAGGMLAFRPDETTLLVAEPDAESVNAYLGGSHTLCKVSGGGPGRIRTVDDRHVISDGDQRVEILAVEKNPHSDEMLVVWLPAHKILFVADLLTGVRDRPAGSNDHLNRFFLDWVKKRHLKPEVIYTAHGQGRVLPELMGTD